MKERPILFSPPMVRSILAGTKTMTRRTRGLDEINKEPDRYEFRELLAIDGDLFAVFWDSGQVEHVLVKCPFGRIGDKTWVRETWQTHCDMDHISPRDLPEGCDIQYPATYDGWVSKRRPSIHMPRWASRILLEITDIRIERLQQISEEDAKAEGVEALDFERYAPDFDWSVCPLCGGTCLYTGYSADGGARPDCDCLKCDTHKKRFRNLWEYLNGEGSWEDSPWVWAISFLRIEQERKAA